MKYKLNEITLDKSITPVWAEKIKRWSQLDEASFVLAEATSKNMDFLSESFDQLVVVSTQGSSYTDHLFVTDAKISPSHFVHTLPNVRTIVFSILTGWEGPMFCLANGKKSLLNFLKEVPLAHKNEKTLVISLNKVNSHFQCDFYMIEDDHVNTELFIDDFAFRSSLRKEL